MNAFREYWTFSAIRGALTLLAAVGILALPYAASAVLSVPVLVGLSIAGWAVYSIFDGLVILLLAVLLPARAKAPSTLFLQSFMNLCIGGLLFLIVYGELNVRYAVGIAVFQAGFAAFAEWTVAQQTHGQYRCLSCYATALVLAVSALSMPFAIGLDGSGIPLGVATFIGLYGAAELSLGARMLFVEYREEHPAAVASQAWRAEKTPQADLTPDAEVAGLMDAARATPRLVARRDHQLQSAA